MQKVKYNGKSMSKVDEVMGYSRFYRNDWIAEIYNGLDEDYVESSSGLGMIASFFLFLVIGIPVMAFFYLNLIVGIVAAITGFIMWLILSSAIHHEIAELMRE